MILINLSDLDVEQSQSFPSASFEQIVVLVKFKKKKFSNDEEGVRSKIKDIFDR